MCNIQGLRLDFIESQFNSSNEWIRKKVCGYRYRFGPLRVLMLCRRHSRGWSPGQKILQYQAVQSCRLTIKHEPI